MIAKRGWSVSGHNDGPVNGEPLTKTQLEIVGPVLLMVHILMHVLKQVWQVLDLLEHWVWVSILSGDPPPPKYLCSFIPLLMTPSHQG